MLAGRVVVMMPLILVAATVEAQSPTATLTGVVRDTSGAPVFLAHVVFRALHTASDSAGRFTLAGLPAGSVTVLVRRLGYEPRDMPVTLTAGGTESLTIVMASLPRDLPGVTTEAASGNFHLAEFFRHRENGLGRYFDRAELVRMRASRISDVVRRVPGVRIVTDRSGRTLVRMGRTSGGRDCPPDIWVDGVRTASMYVDDFPLLDVEAMEVYRGLSGLPPEYNNRTGNPACGAIILWTRLPG